MKHGIIRAVVLPEIITMIEKEYGVNENDALKMFYNSYIGKLYSDNDSGLYGQSANYIFSLFQNELKGR